jgi:hypothetical protein
MIYWSDKEITAITVTKKTVQAVYWGARLVWQAVRSCFGSGVWVPHKPWLGQEKWKNEN